MPRNSLTCPSCAAPLVRKSAHVYACRPCNRAYDPADLVRGWMKQPQAQEPVAVQGVLL